MIVNDDCSWWYNRVGDFLMSVWEKRKEILYGEESQYDPIIKCEANGNNCYVG